MAYRVVAPLVITKNPDGSDRYLYQGAVLPDFVGDDEVKRLVDEKFVEKDGDEPAKSAAKKSSPSAPSN